MNFTITNGLIVNADSSFKSDILCVDGKISRIEKNIAVPDLESSIIDASDCLILPGGIDTHVHLHLPTPTGFSADDFTTGSKAAIAGGTTSLIDFVTPRRGQSIIEALHLRRQEAANSLCDVKLHVSPVEWTDQTEQEIIHCIKNEGIKSFKVYMAYQSTIGLRQEDIFKVMKVVGKHGGIVTMHCEMDEIIEKNRKQLLSQGKTVPKFHPLSRPNAVESEAVKNAIALAEKAECPLYIVHVSTHEALDHIHKAQSKGQPVYAETCPQYLLLDESLYDQPFDQACAYVMSPPLRKKEDREALWQAIADGIILTVGTDHCPFTLEQKRLGLLDFTKIPNGAGGVEHRMSLLYTHGVLKNRISLQKFVEITSTNAAKIFGWYPQKGNIQEGSDADLLVWDPNAKQIISTKTHHQHCDLNVYEGFDVKGLPKYTFISGTLKWNADDADLADFH
ncbi:MAG TPA: dihydropyrimidinase [Bacteroidales bacterium]|nr:dihydropyrimidinase [Bacteroidales bacterium]HRX96022.1 dihydropyrimidinase [Bacteroidales bacterium]